MIFFSTGAAKYFRAIFGAALLFVFASAAAAQAIDEAAKMRAADEFFVLTGERLHSPWKGEIWDAGWRYKPGAGEATWAARDFDDADWEKLNSTQLDWANLPKAGWNRTAWFRLRISVDERLAREPVALRLSHWGASEVYLDGKLLERFGAVAETNENAAQDSEVEKNPRGVPVPFTFETPGEHVIAVRYSLAVVGDLSNLFGLWMAHGRFAPGFDIYLQTARGAIDGYTETVRNYSGNKLFIGTLYSFALLHFLLFIFYRLERTNLFYSFFAFSLANATLSNNIVNSGNQTAFASAIFFMIFAFSYGTAFIALQAFLYEAFAGRFSKFFRLTWILLAVQLILILVFIRNRVSFYATCVLLVVSLADSLRLVVSAVRERREGAWIIAGGVIVLAAGIIMAIAYEFQIYIDAPWYSTLQDVSLFLGVPIAVSIYLARNFARTNYRLQEQLVQVREFAEKEVEHERQEARLLIVEAENQRQSKELEEARQLQLSMLPKKLPNIANLEIAAYMKPATEVGGDYYDFHVADDGTLTVAVGDATGHGLKAGTMVTATKGLFNNLADAPDIADTFGQISRSLKQMNLRGLFMAMTMLKIKDNRFSISAAGMPSTLVYRHATGKVEEISLRAVPLGSLATFKYQEQEFALADNDCIIIMSDGFPEMFDQSGEMLGFDKAAAVLPSIADLTAQEIIRNFVRIGETWANGRPQDDDVTFVVLKFKNQ